MEPEIRISNHTVQIWTKKQDANGSATGEYHIRTIDPDVDISAETEEMQAVCLAARIGYIKPGSGE